MSSRLKVSQPDKHLSENEANRFKNLAAGCKVLPYRLRSVSDFLSAVSTVFQGTESYWFRGQASSAHGLTPSALRSDRKRDRDTAVDLLVTFKRIAEIKLSRAPLAEEDLKWVQIAQHYGLPTRLLDWTESPTIGLFFACRRKWNTDGLVYMLNPSDLNSRSVDENRVLNSLLDSDQLDRFVKLKGEKRSRGLPNVAIDPVWNSERIVVQKGVFTLHGSRNFSLDAEQSTSLIALPILKEDKEQLHFELERLGIDQMTLFPELEHTCQFLTRRAGLRSREEG